MNTAVTPQALVARLRALYRHPVVQSAADGIQGVLDLHQPEDDGQCVICGTFAPCPTVRAIAPDGPGHPEPIDH